MKEKVLILGCGKKPTVGAINHDLHKHHDYVDIAHDLNVLPWPWNNNEFDKVVAWSVLEHLHADRLHIMNELWRIVKPDGAVDIKLPYWDADISYADLTHRWVASPRLMDQLDPDTIRGKEYDFYTPYKWKIMKIRFNKARTSIIFKMRKRLMRQKKNGEN